MRDWETVNVRARFSQQRRQEGQGSLCGLEEKGRKGILCTREHTWAKVTSQGHVKVGLCDFPLICKQLSKITHVLIESIGEKVRQMEPFGVVETWNFILDIYAPVSGRLRKLNGGIGDDPHIIVEDPYGSGWIAEIDPINLEDEIKNLLDFMKYEEHCKELCFSCPKKNCTLSSPSF